MEKMTCVLIILLWNAVSVLTAQPEKNDIGQFYNEFQKYADNRLRSMSYLSEDWPEPEQWKISCRAKLMELLAFQPEPAAHDPEILEKTKKDGYTRYKVKYSITPFRRTEAFLLVPDGLKGPAPAIIALHDHGGFYYYGKEKITETENQPEILREFIRNAYGGRTYADELARRGFVVLCPDAFYFGSQKLDPELLPGDFRDNFPNIQSKDINISIEAHNQFYSSYEQIMARYLFGSGTTWPGVLFHGDRVAVDFLLSRPEVDASRIGCIGLSIGGFRSAHLFGLDPRISVCVDAGWMTSYSMQMENHFRHHTWMIYVPRQLEYLDLPDVVTLGAPKPLMIINCKKDQLSTMEAMEASAGKIVRVYEKFGAPDRIKVSWYDVPHSFNTGMQDDAIRWLELWLKK